MLLSVTSPSRGPSIGSALRSLIAVAAVLGLLISSLGPLIDHHFAERQPHHEHVYFWSQGSDHSHSYGLDHRHHPIASTDRAAQTEDPVMLTSNDATAGGVSLLSSVSTDSEITLPDQDDTWLLFRPADHDRLLNESFLSLPKKPPRA